MMRLLTQLLLAASLVEMVPADVASLELQSLPEAENGRPVLQTIERAFQPLPPPSSDRAPEQVDVARLGVVTSAVSALVVDDASGQILFEKNAREVRAIGSLTKLLAAAVFLETEPDLSLSSAILPEDVRAGGRDHLYVEDPLSLYNLLEASLIGSDNPATMALMRLSGHSQEAFVDRMNLRALSMGMTDSFFTEPTGLDARNVSTSLDVVRLLDAVLDHPVIAEITRRGSASFTSGTGRSYAFPSTNQLLQSYLNRDPYQVLGGKTGFLPEAGYGLGVKVMDEAGHAIYSVVLGSETSSSRFQEVKGLSQWAFDVFRWPDER
ncbi:MAG: D-alanyl-D-alanine carboxypeptidase family protein [Parcubacteria group bacterium GW2011_GWA2_56_7]|nr:MAG: D-alanyl-D-alanine carboxypeptidase family protein [Parcubacteria group bacterium GW2011_GWA2_56_7]